MVQLVVEWSGLQYMYSTWNYGWATWQKMKVLIAVDSKRECPEKYCIKQMHFCEFFLKGNI